MLLFIAAAITAIPTLQEVNYSTQTFNSGEIKP